MRFSQSVKMTCSGSNSSCKPSIALGLYLVLKQQYCRIVKQLKPLAIAANLFQAPYCRLDHVLLGLGRLYWFYGSQPPDKQLVASKMQKSIEQRWNATDQELFILGLFFNPYIRTKCFNSATLPHATLYAILCNAVKRFICRNNEERTAIDRDSGLFDAFGDYISSQNKYSNAVMCVELYKQKAEEKVSSEHDA